MQNPNKRFEFPIKPWKTEIDLAPATKGVIIIAAVAIGGGLLINALKR